MRTYRLFINNEFSDAADGRTFTGINPYTQEPIAQFARAGAADVARAVAAAREAFDRGPWPRMSREERAALLKAVSDRINEHKNLFVELEVQDSGSTIRKAGEDIYLSARNLANFAKLGLTELDRELDGVSKPGLSKNLLLHEPIGVVAAIIPWNFPLKMAVWKLGPALMAGNTVVLKPSEETSVTIMELAQHIREVGFPPGVVNIVTGFGTEAGAELVKHPLVDKIAFTGSTLTGQYIMQAAAPHLKKLTLECGGKSANIVLDDADLELAVDGAMYAIFYHAGQCCEAGTRLLLPNSIADRFVEMLVEKTKQIRLGDPMQPTTDMGPLISQKQLDRVLGYIQKGKAEGARLLVGGGRPTSAECAKGFFVEPTIFDHVNNRSTIAQEEIFGPVLSIIRYTTDDEAVALANDSIYGLAAGVWSRDRERAMNVARRLRAGTVWINEWHLLNERAPFGGYKQSGIGREFGIEGLKEYMELKHLYIAELQERAKRTWYDVVVPPQKVAS
ncbi:MAG TPA: aldehyde dehydrogenase family protein [Bacteroidota bacterium]|nr:aldehyde dehydrogenase family protein [Bacteroidota bacterium]